MNTDTSFADNTQQSSVDPAYAEVIAGIDDTPEPNREVGYEPVPRFPMYHVRFEGASSGFTKNKGSAFTRPTAVILAGPEGTVGRLVSDDIYFSVSDTTRDKKTGVERPKTEAERIAAIDETRKTLKRIAVQLDLDRTVPSSLTEDGLRLYAAGFSGKEAIVAIRVDKGNAQFPPKNRIVWRSLASPHGPAAKGDGTALEEAIAAIEKFNTKQKTSNAAKTVAGTKAARAKDFV